MTTTFLAKTTFPGFPYGNYDIIPPFAALSVATIGIRGTKVAGRAAQEGEQNTISLLPETDTDGNTVIGELAVSNQAGTVTLSRVGAAVQMTSSFEAPPPVIFSPQQIQLQYGTALNTLPPPPDKNADNGENGTSGENEASGENRTTDGAAPTGEEVDGESPPEETGAPVEGDNLPEGEQHEPQIIDFNPAEVFAKNAQSYKPIDFKNISLDIDLFQLSPLEFSARMTAIIENQPSVQSVVGTVGIYRIYGTAGDDVLFGTGVQDYIFGRAGNDTLLGFLSNDFFNGGPGDDTINGGDGRDTADYTDDTAGITVDLAANTASGVDIGSDTFVSIEIVWGGSGDDSYTGSPNSDTFSGNGGNDTAIGSAGNDALDGGTGTDTLDLSSYSNAIAINLSTGTGVGSDTLSNIESGTGGSANDTLTGDANANVFTGRAPDKTPLQRSRGTPKQPNKSNSRNVFASVLMDKNRTKCPKLHIKFGTFGK